MDKRSAFFAIPLAIVTGIAVAQQAEPGISSQIINQSHVVRIGTTLNHVSVIELPELIRKAVIGSEYIRMEYQGNTVLIEPLKAGVSTNLFVWTEHTRTTYEIQPSTDNATLTYAVAQNFAPPPLPPPGPTPQEAEQARDHSFSPFLLTMRAIKTPHLHMNHPGVNVKLVNVAEDSHSYYVRLTLINNTSQLYRVKDPTVFHVSPLFGERMAVRAVDEQLTEKKFAKVFAYDSDGLRTHGSSLVPADLRPGQSADWVIAFDKPAHRPAMYMFEFPEGLQGRVRAVAVF